MNYIYTQKKAWYFLWSITDWIYWAELLLAPLHHGPILVTDIPYWLLQEQKYDWLQGVFHFILIPWILGVRRVRHTLEMQLKLFVSAINLNSVWNFCAISATWNFKTLLCVHQRLNEKKINKMWRLRRQEIRYLKSKTFNRLNQSQKHTNAHRYRHTNPKKSGKSVLGFHRDFFSGL